MMDMVYKDFLDLTDDEIRFILTDIFHPKKIGNIVRNRKRREIDVDMTTEWGHPEDEDGVIEITDQVTLTEEKIYVDFQMASGDLTKYRQFLLSKGCHYLLKDNPYMDKAR